MKRIVKLSAFISFGLLAFLANQTDGKALPAANAQTLILASPDDAYYGLAQEIAAAEQVPICHTLAEVITAQPTFLLWVAAPASLSAKTLMLFNKMTQETTISAGIITGNSMAAARNLWLKASQKPGHFYVVVNGRPVPATHTKLAVVQYRNGQSTALPLTRQHILANLAAADYFVYNSHSGPGAWSENIQAQDLPALNSAIIFSYGCNNLNVSRPNTIALTCIDQGAKAYAGYLYSPHASTIIGKNDGLTCQYTWPEFPIGHIARIHNQELTKWMATVPYFFLLGDPRLSFQSAPPYRLAADQVDADNSRVLRFADATIGFIPVRISHGAQYQFVSIAHNTASSVRDHFFNSRLQMIDIGADKYLLLKNNSKEFTLTLYSHATLSWLIQDYVLDAFDKYVESLQHPSLYPFLVIVPIIHVLVLARQKKLQRKHLLSAVTAGILWILFIGVFTVIRWDDITVTSKILVFGADSVLSMIGNFLFIVYGGLLFFKYRSVFVKILAVLAAVIHEVLGTLIWIGLPLLLNVQANMQVFKIHYLDLVLVTKVAFILTIFYSLKKFFLKSSVQSAPVNSIGIKPL